MSKLFSFPKKIQIQTINLCNYSCRMCPYPAGSDLKAQRLERALFTRIIEDVRNAGERVELCLMLQNEPLLDKRFIDFLAEAHEASDAIIEISTVTNGSTLNAEVLTLLMQYPRFGLTISINATEREQYRSIHGVDMLDKVVSLLKKWEGARERIRLSYIADVPSLPNAREFQEAWQDSNYRLRLVPILSRAGSVPIDEERRIMFDPEYSYCHYPTDTLNVIADGRVILCCQDWKHATSYGNLNDASISEIWNSPAMTQIRTAAIAGKLREHVSICATCDYPMRSSMRLALESLFRDSGPSLGRFPVVEHQALLRIGSRAQPIRVLICEIAPAGGYIEGLISDTDPQLEALTSFKEGAFRLSGFEGKTLSFGAMSAVWCPIESISIQRIESTTLVGLRIYLDRSAEEFQLLQWYRAEWEHLALP
jgi:MoaA/NifB/PqqE/SkfB family radical SAM enzyme